MTNYPESEKKPMTISTIRVPTQITKANFRTSALQPRKSWPRPVSFTVSDFYMAAKNYGMLPEIVNADCAAKQRMY